MVCGVDAGLRRFRDACGLKRWNILLYGKRISLVCDSALIPILAFLILLGASSVQF
jgi:hypothetical protein